MSTIALLTEFSPSSSVRELGAYGLQYYIQRHWRSLQCFDAGGRKGIRPVKNFEWWGAVVVISLEPGADLHMAQLMPLPLTVSCFSKIQIGFSFLVPAHLGSPGQRVVKWVCVCVCVCVCALERPVQQVFLRLFNWQAIAGKLLPTR